jgi:hypothetical protein
LGYPSAAVATTSDYFDDLMLFSDEMDTINTTTAAVAVHP